MRSLLLTASVLALAAAATGQDDVRAVPLASVRLLSEGPGACADPVIATRGDDALVAWEGTLEGRTRIFAVRRINRDWTFPYPVDGSLDGDCVDPVARFAPGGQPGIAWVRRDGEVSTLEFAPPGGFPGVVAASPLRMESPALAFGKDGSPLLVWTEGEAGRYAILAARPDGNGGWTRERLSTSPDSYDVFPQVFGGEIPAVFWYGLGAEDFTLRGAALQSDGWTALAPSLPESVPANRFPLLFETGTEPGALWVEPLSEGEIVAAWDGSRGIGRELLPMPGEPGVRQMEPDAAPDSGSAAFAWCEEGPAGSAVVVMDGGVLHRLQGLPHPAQPRIARGTGGLVHLVVVSDRTDGGTGQVYWAPLVGLQGPEVTNSPRN